MDYVTSITLLKRLDRDHPTSGRAWDEFVARYTPVIAGFARNLGVPPHEIDDIIQDVLTSWVSAQERFDYDPQRGRFRGYLKTAVTRAIARKASRTQLLDGRPIDQIDPADERIERALDASIDRDRMLRALDLLRSEFADNDTFKAFYRTAIDEADPAQVAQELGKKPNAIYQAKFRVTARLREVLKRMETDERELW